MQQLIKISVSLLLFISFHFISLFGQGYLPNIANVARNLTITEFDQAYTSDNISNSNSNLVSFGVDVSNGNLTFSETDIEWYLFDGEISFIRTYNNYSTTKSKLGDKWSHNFEIFLEFKSDKILILHNSNNEELIFYRIKSERVFITKTTSDTLFLTSSNKINIRTGNNMTLEFNNLGLLSKITDSNLNSCYLLYNNSNQLQLLFDPIGREMIFMYNKLGLLQSITSPDNGMIIYTYNEKKLLSSVNYHDGSSRQYNYDENSWLSSLQDLNTAIFRYKYSNSGKIRSITDPQENTEYYDFKNFPNNKCIYTDSDNNKWTYITDNGKIIKGSSPDGKTYNLTRNKKGKLTRYISSNGLVTDYIYIKNKLSQIRRSDNKLTTLIYDNYGNIVHLKSDRNELKFKYNADNQLIEKIDLEDMITERYTRNLWGLVSKLEVDNQYYYAYYDTLGNILKIKSPYGMEVFKYDIMGNMISYSDTLNNTFTASFDIMNRIKDISFSEKTILGFIYDSSGNLTKITGPEGNYNTYNFDKLNRLTEINSGTKRYIYYDKSGLIVGSSKNEESSSIFFTGPLNRKEIKFSLDRHPLFNISEQIKSGKSRIDIPIKNTKRIMRKDILDDWRIFFNL